MELKEAIEYCLTQTINNSKVTKYRIGKICGVQPIMVDKWLNEDTKTIRRDAAEPLMKTFDIQINDNRINGFQKEMFINRNNQLDH